MSSMGMSPRLVVLWVVLAGLVGCGHTGQTSTFVVDGHTFNVPTSHLLPDHVRWLPFGRSAGFNFTEDPQAGPSSHVLVTLEPIEVTCRADKIESSTMLRNACARDGKIDVAPADGDVLEKSQRTGDETQWIYTVTNARTGTKSVPVAACYLRDLKPRMGSCLSLGRFDSIVYSVRYSDADIEKLAATRQRVEALLSAWERR